MDTVYIHVYHLLDLEEIRSCLSRIYLDNTNIYTFRVMTRRNSELSNNF
jgi:hypothetical protein